MLEQGSRTAERAQELVGEMSEWRRWLHAHPELSFQEWDTARWVTRELEKVPGMTIQTGVAKTGVIGTLTSGSGPTILIRADMDALPIQEQTDQSYRSQNDGVMHACGHDAHTSILLGVVRLISEAFQRDEMQGTVRFLFQPAEEDIDEHGLTGAQYVVQEGVLEGMEAAIALHVSPGHPVGQVLVHPGYSMASVDIFTGKIQGTGGHAAYPHLSTDPIWALGSVLQTLHGIVSRRVSPLEPAVLSVTEIDTGKSSNIIPTEVSVRGTLRSYRPEVRELLIKEVERTFAMVEHFGCRHQFSVNRGEPALYNTPTICHWLTTTMKDLYPQLSILEEPYGLAGEDFGHIAQRMPAAMFFLGCALPDQIARDLHTPIFDIDEACMPIGAAVLAETAIRFLQGKYHRSEE